MITVAVIDTGVDIYHNKLYKYINLSKSFVDESLTDKNGHGIAITGIILFVINALQINNDLPISISSKLKKYIHKPD
ncbi:subtilase family protein [Staphylococcus aureus]|nr:subtilase family protein [Staphylococcus aureus]